MNEMRGSGGVRSSEGYEFIGPGYGSWCSHGPYLAYL